MSTTRGSKRAGWLFAVTVLGVCSSCANQAMQAEREAATQLIAAGGDCRRQYDNGVLPTHSARIQCVNNAYLRIYAVAGYPNMDLVILANAYRSALGRRLDAHQMTVEEAELLQAQLGTRLAQEDRRRALESAQVAATQAQASAAQAQGYASILQGLAAWSSASRPSVTTVRQQITCVQTGTIVTCQ